MPRRKASTPRVQGSMEDEEIINILQGEHSLSKERTKPSQGGFLTKDPRQRHLAFQIKSRNAVENTLLRKAAVPAQAKSARNSKLANKWTPQLKSGRGLKMIRNAYSSLARYENTSSKKSFSPDVQSSRKGVRPGDIKQRFDSLVNQSYDSPDARRQRPHQGRCTSALSTSRNRHVEASYYSNSVFGGVSHYG